MTRASALRTTLLAALTALLLGACGPGSTGPADPGPGGANTPPTAEADAYALEQDTPLAVEAPGVLGNDADPDEDALSAELTEAPTLGSVTLEPDGSFVYTPDSGRHGSDAFRYRASDGSAVSDPVVVELTIAPLANRPPEAGDDGYLIAPEGAHQAAAPGLLANDVDPNGDPLTAELLEAPAHGTLDLQPDGAFAYTPDAGFTGADAFTYRASDGENLSAPARVTLIGTTGEINWTTTGSNAKTAVGRIEAQGAFVDGRLYLFGGYVDDTFRPSDEGEVFDIASNAWSATSDLPVGLTHSGVAVVGERIYLAGGYPPASEPDTNGKERRVCTTAVWAYHTTSDSWSAAGEIPDLPQCRGSGALVHMRGRLHFFGGSDEHHLEQRDHWVLDLDGGDWQPAAPLPEPRTHMGYTALNGLIYAVGGQTGQDAELVTQPEVFRYRPAEDAWEALAPLPQPLSHIAGATVPVGDHLFVIGGEKAHADATHTVYAFDPDDGAQGSWRAFTRLPIPRYSGVAGAHANTLYYATGGPGFDASRVTYVGVLK